MKYSILFTFLSLLINLISWTQQNPPSSLGGFETNDTIGCSPLLVNFHSLTSNGVTFNWNFGNGNTSTLENPSELFQTSGEYTITLDVVYTDGSAEQFVKTDYINAVAKPMPIININAYDACSNTNSLQFENNTIGAYQYLWDFGDGSVVTDFAATHHYSQPGNYTATLIATNNLGCTGSISMDNIIIHAVTSNDFQITGGNQSCDSAYVFPFTASPPNLVSYTWEFSDGSQNTGVTIQKTFNAYGVFDLLLITEDDNGCIDSTATNSVVATSNVLYDFSTSSTSNCEDRNILFTSLGSNLSSVSWDFGDGFNGSGTTAYHAYANSGSYTVSMTAVSASGCSQTIEKINYIEISEPPIASVTVSDTLVCLGESIQFDAPSLNAADYNWIFGNGISVSSSSTSHTYNEAGVFQAEFIYGFGGCLDTINRTITVSHPNVQFQNPSIHNCAPVDIAFLDQTSSAILWEWNFSNGEISTDQNPIISFVNSGDYDAQLVATDVNGCVDSITIVDAVSIFNSIPNNLQSSHFSGCAPMSISFYNYAVGNGDWNWNFGDGTTSNSSFPSHTYSESGDYIVSLSTLNSLGCSFYIDTFAIVTVNTLEIDSLALNLNCQDLEINFSSNCSECLSEVWNFGDGNSESNLATSSYTYADNETYYVSYMATSQMGCVGSKLYEVDLADCSVSQVTEDPLFSSLDSDETEEGWAEDSTSLHSEAFFTYCGPFTVNFFNPVPNAQSWMWYFGDGETAVGPSPIHLYDSIGVFSLKLIYMDGGVTDTLYFHNYINVLGHTNDIIINSLSTCDGLDLSLMPQDSQLESYFWSIDNNPIQNNSIGLDTLLTSNNELHSITLTTIDTNMCTHSASIGVISNGINPGFVFDTLICLGDSLIVNHNVPNGYQINWNYGQGNISNHSYNIYSTSGNFDITAEIIDMQGCIENYSIGQVQVIESISNFNLISPSSLCVGDTLYVEALQDMNSFYNWDFGNHTELSSGSNASAIVVSSGTFDIELETGSYGCNAVTLEPSVFIVNQAVADFNLTQTNFCLPITPQLTDMSVSPVSWSWTLGDGSTDLNQNPTHTFIVEPAAQINLEITDINGCRASISKNNIELFNVDVDVSSENGCAPAPISFTETSQNAVDWLWSFGDGLTSVEQNPIHIYTDNGSYDVSLIVTSSGGCLDTITYNSMVNIDQVRANFSSISGGGCAPQVAYFTDSSYNAVSWEWNFGNGYTSALQNPIHIYYTGGNYATQLIVESSTGCKDTIASATLSIIGPYSDFTIVDSLICSNDSVEFVNSSLNAVSYMWLFGDGSTSTLFSPKYKYSNFGNYDISLWTVDLNGCQSISSQNINISMIDTPDNSFTITDTIGCSPLSISLQANSIDLQYQWILDGASVGTLSSYSNILSAGVYSFMLVTENQEGCVDTSSINTVEVFELEPVHLTPLNPICENQNSVTVLSSDSIGTWYIDGVSNPNGTFDVSSLSPGDHSIVIEISTYCEDADTITLHIDSIIASSINAPDAVCEYEEAFNLQSSSTNGVWSGIGITNPYIGTIEPAFANYGSNIITYTLINGACTFIDSINVIVNQQPNSLFTLVGPHFCEESYIEIVSPENDATANYTWTMEGEQYTINSNEILPSVNLNSGNWNVTLTVENEGCVNSDSLVNIWVHDVIAPNTPSIIRSTVEDDAVITEWDPPKYGLEKITGFQIWRSIDSINFSIIDFVENLDYSYIDEKTEVNEQNYYYLIIPENVCKVIPEKNLMSSSILLQKEEINGDKIKFSWNEYHQWNHGVDYYELQMREKDGDWTTIKTVNSSTHSAIIEKP